MAEADIEGAVFTVSFNFYGYFNKQNLQVVLWKNLNNEFIRRLKMDEKRFSLNDILEALDGIIEDGIKDYLREAEEMLRNGFLPEYELREWKEVIAEQQAIKSLRHYMPEKLGFEWIREIGEDGFKETKWVYKGDTQG